MPPDQAPVGCQHGSVDWPCGSPPWGTDRVCYPTHHRRSNRSTASLQALTEAVALVIALSEDYRNRVWEQRNALDPNAVAAWDLKESRLAQSRVRLLTSDPKLLDCERALQRAGTELGKAIRLAPTADADVQQAWDAHRLALDSFVVEGRRVLGK